MRIGAEDIGVARGDPESIPHQVLDELAAPAVVVLALGVLHDGLIVDVGELHPDHRIARVPADVNLRHPPGPLLHLGQHDACLAAGQRGLDRAVVERGQPGRGQLLQRRDLGRDRRQQQRLGQPVIGPEPGRQAARILGGLTLSEVVRGQQDRPQLLPVQGCGGPEQRGGLRVEGVPALHDVVKRVAHRDNVIHGQRVPPADEHLLHDLQRRPLPLHDAGQRSQCRHQGRGERVRQPERRLVGAAVPVVGVDPVEQHVPDIRTPVQPRERVGEHLFGLRIVRPPSQQPPVRHIRQVVVAELDGAEATLLEPEGLVQGLLLGAACTRVSEPPPQVHLPGHEGDQRDRARPGGRFHENAQLRGLPAEELAILHRERQPQHQLVQEEHDSVVAQALRMRRDRGQPGGQVHVGSLLGISTEVVLDKRGHQKLARLRPRFRRAAAA